MRAADLVVEALALHGVRQVFGIPGDAINHMTDAMRRRDDVRFIQVRHEEAGAFAAAAQAKLTGGLGACMGTAGPGAVHLLNGLYDAAMDHAPVIAVTGQVETPYLGTAHHQEVNLERLFGDVALYSRTVTGPGQLPAVILEACRAAITGRGVAHVSIPADVAGRQTDARPSDLRRAPPLGWTLPGDEEMARAVELIEGAERIAILAGIGSAGAREPLLAFARRVGAPVVRSLRAKDVLDDTEPEVIGGLGQLGSEPAMAAMAHCDLLLMVGTDFPYRDFYPADATTIQIDAEPARIGRRHAVDLGLVGHACPVLQALLGAVAERSETPFMSAARAEMDRWLADQEAVETATDQPVKPQRLMRDIAEEAPQDTVFVVDTGTVTAWSARHLRTGRGQRYTLSSALGSMAFALPGAIGAALACPGRPVMALAGDGGFTMLMADLVTAVREGLPVVCIVLNNGELGFIRLEQEAEGLPGHAVRLANPDLAALARACGAEGITVREPAAIRPALRQALAAGGPAVVDVHVDAGELFMPPRIGVKDAVSYGVAKAREWLGGGDG